MKALISVDVEDWFQVENLNSVIKRTEWNLKESRVQKNVELILDIFNNNNTKATFFVLGWIAEKFPELIKKISDEGHEIASHGYGHDLIYNLDKSEFKNDLIKSKSILEDISGKQVYGYRAPSFSITEWAVDILIKTGFLYDSSLFQAFTHDRYGKLDNCILEEKPIFELKKGFYQVKLSCLNIFNKNLPWAGGGYFRVIPYFLFRKGIKKILKKQNVFCFYIHPWEFDPDQPRVKNIKLQYKFRHYNNLKSTKIKFERLIGDFNFGRIIDALKN